MTQTADDGFWKQLWVDDYIPFHEKEVHPTVIKYIAELTAGQEKCRIFVPLCGKSEDIKWLADRGHTVVGVELSAIAIQDFFKERKMEFTSSPIKEISGAELYKSKDDRIHLYIANIFDLNRDLIGEFDCIWDRGSLEALLREDIQRYADLMRSLLKPNGRCLLSTFEYDQSKMKGPPFSTPLKVIEQLYAEGLIIKPLETEDSMSAFWRNKGLDYLNTLTTLLTKK